MSVPVNILTENFDLSYKYSTFFGVTNLDFL